jgi:carbamoyl-phosphate synthase/aspartate carbamoyltransferase/dihydroorotase
MHTNPKKIFGLPDQTDTFVEVDTEASWKIQASNTFTRCGWTPFESREVRGKIERVVLHGQDAYKDEKILAKPGSGKNVRNHQPEGE